MTSKPHKKDASTTEETTSAMDVSVQTVEPAKKTPYWSDQSASNRVRASLWRHDQKGGKVRYTVALCRSYFDEQEKHWVNTHFFDARDLDDVIALAQEAKATLASLRSGDAA